MAAGDRLIMRGRVVRLDAAADGLPWVVVPQLGADRAIGPCLTVRGDALEVGDAVLCVATNGTPDDLVVIGRLAAAATGLIPVKPATDSPGTYPVGLSIFGTSATGWPEQLGTVVTHYADNLDRTMQTYHAKSGQQYTRSGNAVLTGGGWTAWRTVVYSDDARVNPYPHLARAVATGGGTVKHTAGALTWTERFITLGAGRGATTAPEGYFNINQPPVGTVIPGVMGHAGATVTASGVPLGAWDTLYYILPLGAVDPGTVAANFRLANYTADFVVPPTWIAVATRNSDRVNGYIRLCNGTTIIADSGLDWPGVDVVTARTNLNVNLTNNTSDAAKPVSTAQQTALDTKVAKAANLADLASGPSARANLGLGSAAQYAIGNVNGTVPLLETNNRLPMAAIAGGLPNGQHFVRDDGVLSLISIPAEYAPAVNGVLSSGRVGRYSRIGNTITGMVQFNLTAVPEITVTISLPVPAQVGSFGIGPTYVVGQATGLRTGTFYKTGIVYIPSVSPGIFRIISDGSGTAWGPGNPTAWAAGDTWGLSFTYEAAG